MNTPKWFMFTVIILLTAILSIVALPEIRKLKDNQISPEIHEYCSSEMPGKYDFCVDYEKWRRGG